MRISAKLLATVDSVDVGVVFAEGAREQMSSAAVGGCDEVEVIGFGRLEHGPDRWFTGVADRPRWQTRNHVGIERRVDLQVGGRQVLFPVVIRARGRAVAGGEYVLHRRIGLQ